MNNPFKNYLNNNAPFRIQLLIIIFIGIGLRVFHYLYNRSLWMDEVYLSSSLSHLSYLDLATRVLDYEQKAPIGFLWMVKLCVNLFGYNEMALRLIPLISGIVSLFLFAKTCRYFLKPGGQLLAIMIFSLAPALIYHTVEIKQYSIECLSTIIAIYLFTIYDDRDEWKYKVKWGIFGSIIIWFSFSVIFVLAGFAISLSINHFIKKNWNRLIKNILPFSLWLISFIINYLFFTHKHAESQWIVYFFKVYENFMPFPPHTMGQLKWFPKNFIDMLDYPLGLYMNLKDTTNNTILNYITLPLVPATLFFSGIYSLFTYNKRIFYILISPVLFMCIASGLLLYPLVERFWVFIAPIFIIFISIGFEYFQVKIKSKTSLWIIIILVIAAPIIQSSYSIFKPQKFYKHKKSFERESLMYVYTHLKEGDAVYNYWNNAPGYSVYKHIFDFEFKVLEGNDFRKKSKSLSHYNANLQQDFIRFKGCKRVWVICNNQFLTDIGDKVDSPLWYYKNKLAPNDNLFQQLTLIAKPIRKFVNSDITIYLFEDTPFIDKIH